MAGQAWIGGLPLLLHLGPAEISRRLLHSIFAKVLTFFNANLDFDLPGSAGARASGLLGLQAYLENCEKKLVMKRHLL